MEKEFLEEDNTLPINKFGWRRVDFFISPLMEKPMPWQIILLIWIKVTEVGKSIGEHTIDLSVETIVRDNHELLVILEKLKAMDGIQDAVWSEIVGTVGIKCLYQVTS